MGADSRGRNGDVRRGRSRRGQARFVTGSGADTRGGVHPARPVTARHCQTGNRRRSEKNQNGRHGPSRAARRSPPATRTGPPAERIRGGLPWNRTAQASRPHETGELRALGRRGAPTWSVSARPERMGRRDPAAGDTGRRPARISNRADARPSGVIRTPGRCPKAGAAAPGRCSRGRPSAVETRRGSGRPCWRTFAL